MREIDTKSYIIPPTLIILVQNGASFSGLDNEDTHAHVRAFIFLSNTCKLTGVSQDNLRMMLFPFSLRGNALAWYTTSKGYAIATFDKLV